MNGIRIVVPLTGYIYESEKKNMCIVRVLIYTSTSRKALCFNGIPSLETLRAILNKPETRQYYDIVRIAEPHIVQNDENYVISVDVAGVHIGSIKFEFMEVSALKEEESFKNFGACVYGDD